MIGFMSPVRVNGKLTQTRHHAHVTTLFSPDISGDFFWSLYHGKVMGPMLGK